MYRRVVRSHSRNGHPTTQKWPHGRCPPAAVALGYGYMPMNLRNTDPNEFPEVALRAEDLYDVETYFRQKGASEFPYDEELDVFRFPEDGRFAFCREFADWRRLRERGYRGS
jgi:hypothetical protein